jgi:hypothetical protein
MGYIFCVETFLQDSPTLTCSTHAHMHSCTQIWHWTARNPSCSCVVSEMKRGWIWQPFYELIVSTSDRESMQNISALT